MGQYTRWRIITRPPVSTTKLDPKNLHDSRGDAIIAAMRLVFGDQEIRTQRDRAAAWTFLWSLMQRGRMKYENTTYIVRSIEPVYFASEEEKEEKRE